MLRKPGPLISFLIIFSVLLTLVSIPFFLFSFEVNRIFLENNVLAEENFIRDHEITGHAVRCRSDHPRGFVHTHGAKLFLDGRPLNGVGLNFYKAFRMYLNKRWDDQWPNSRERAKKDLLDISKLGVSQVRVMGPFGASEYIEVFFDRDPEIQRQKRTDFFKSLDGFLGHCDALGLKIVFVLWWEVPSLADIGGESLHKALTDPDSRSFSFFKDYVGNIVGRYKNDQTIFAWEIGNEYNLFADHQLPGGVIRPDSWIHPVLFFPVIRGVENNFNSVELSSFFRRAENLIKSIDKNHVVSLGTAEPRNEAAHLLKSAQKNQPPDWRNDSASQRNWYMKKIFKGGDVVSIHSYSVSADEQKFKQYVRFSQRSSKPLFLGEVGPRFKKTPDGQIKGPDYSDPLVVEETRQITNLLAELKIPVSLWWTYDCSDGDPGFKLCRGKTDAALEIIRTANKKLAGL